MEREKGSDNRQQHHLGFQFTRTLRRIVRRCFPHPGKEPNSVKHPHQISVGRRSKGHDKGETRIFLLKSGLRLVHRRKCSCLKQKSWKTIQCRRNLYSWVLKGRVLASDNNSGHMDVIRTNKKVRCLWVTLSWCTLRETIHEVSDSRIYFTPSRGIKGVSFSLVLFIPFNTEHLIIFSV